MRRLFPTIRAIGPSPADVLERAPAPSPPPTTHPLSSPRRELWRQSAGHAIRKQFPKYTVDLLEMDDFGPCELTVKYTNGRTQTVAALHLTLQDLFDVMSEETDATQLLEEKDELEKG